MRKQKALVAMALIAGLTQTVFAAGPLTLVNGGQAQAQIVVPKTALPVVTYAAEELQYHIRKATGSELPIVTEDHVGEAFACHIYLGDCEATREAGLLFEKEPSPAEMYRTNWRVRHAIRTVGNNLYMAGHDSEGAVGSLWLGTRHGTLFAVYDFLENQMEVSWLWPGELGEVIPARKTLTVDPLDVAGQERFTEAVFSVQQRADKETEWQSAENCHAFVEARNKWLLRHRMNVANSVRYASANPFLNDLVGKHLKKHPEWFQKCPDGSRGYTPFAQEYWSISFCRSNPSFQDQIINDWFNVKTRSEFVRTGHRGWMLMPPAQDAPEGCTCAACRAWDPPSDKRFQNHDYWSDGKLIKDNPELARWQAGRPDSQGRPAPLLSPRYCRYLLDIQKRALVKDPDAVILGWPYVNAYKPASGMKLNDGITLLFENIWPSYPWSDNDIEVAKDDWNKWHDTGARLILRPDTFYFYLWPILQPHKIGELFSYHATNDAVATYFDGYGGFWGNGGLIYFLVARKHLHPDWSVDKILEEYYSAFGDAAASIRAYYAYWENVTESTLKHSTTNAVQRTVQEEAEQGLDTAFRFGSRTTLIKNGPAVFTPEIMAAGRELLGKARLQVGDDEIALQRVDYLSKALKHTELALEVVRANQNCRPGDYAALKKYAAAMEALMQFRKEVVEPEMLANVGRLAGLERGGGYLDHSLTTASIDLAAAWRTYFTDRQFGHAREYGEFEDRTGAYGLNRGWRFSPDTDKKGLTNGWQTCTCDDSQWSPMGVDSHWRDQPWGKKWKREHADKDYEGIGWYKLHFTLPDHMDESDQTISLFFGAVDAACKVWLNGQLICERELVGNSWREPFQVDITDTVKRKGDNILTVRVDYVAGSGGIWKNVWLVRGTDG